MKLKCCISKVKTCSFYLSYCTSYEIMKLGSDTASKNYYFLTAYHYRESRLIFFYAFVSSLSLCAPFWFIFSISMMFSLSLLWQYDACATLLLEEVTRGRQEQTQCGTNDVRICENYNLLKHSLIIGCLTTVHMYIIYFVLNDLTLICCGSNKLLKH